MNPVAVLLPGAGSSADFLRRAFGPALARAGYELVAVPPVPGPGVVPAALAALDAAAAAYGPRLRLVGGVSLGAHLALRWTATAAARPTPAPAAGPAARAGAGGVDAARAATGDADGGAGAGTGGGAGAGTGGGADGAAGAGGGAGAVGLDGVVLALPAWSGAPGMVAAATAAAAGVVERLGTAGALAAAGTAVPWVAEELAAAWPGYGDRLAASLRAAAACPGPTPAELAAVGVPVGLVAFADDPLHPAAVAREWAAALPRAALRTLPLAALARDRAPLGAAALAALTEARGT